MKIDVAAADWFGRERAVNYAKLIALAFAPSLVVYWFRATGPLGSDFLNFWAAGKLVVMGAPAQAYAPTAMRTLQLALGRDHWFPFISPPPMLAVVAPFGLLPYAWALPVFVVLTYFVWLAVARRLLPGASWPVAAFPGAAVAAWHAQSGFITSALLIGGLLALPRKPFFAGVLFGCLIIKPHLALFVPVALLAARAWRPIAGAAITVVGLLLSSLLLFGVGTFQAYFAAAPMMSALLSNWSDPGLFQRMCTPFALLRALGFSVAAAGFVQLALAVALGALVWRTWSRETDSLRRAGILVFAATIGTPYLFNYDLPMLIVPICWLAQEGMTKGFRRWERAQLAAFYWMPLFARAFSDELGFNPTPVFLLLFLFIALRHGARNPAHPVAASADGITTPAPGQASTSPAPSR
jgi:hypothetical protein